MQKSMHLLLILLFFTMAFFLHAGERGDSQNVFRQVKYINSLTFEKAVISRSEGGSSDSYWRNEKIQIYRDKRSKKIRKVDYRVEGPFSSESIVYYDEKGKILHVICATFLTDSESSVESYTSCQYRDGEIAQKQFVKLEGGDPVEADDSIACYDNSFEKSLAGKMTYLDSCLYRRPIPGDNTIVNRNFVIMRSGPGTSNDEIMRCNVFAQVEIISAGKEDTIGAWGTDKWYRVNCGEVSGWIFGAFLDPVEVNLSEK